MILTANISKPTVRRIRTALQEKTGKRLLITSSIDTILKHNASIKLRYGNSTAMPPHEREKDTRFNSASDVKFLASKLSVSLQLLNKGFVCPEFMQDIQPSSGDFPLFIRETLSGFKGKGLIFIKNSEEFEKNWKDTSWWCKAIPTSSEYRVHIVKSPETGEVKILRLSKKVLRNDEIEEGEFPVRVNIDYKFSLRNTPEKSMPKLVDKILKAGEELPGFFFSFDVGWSRELNDAVFFETNTASGMDNGAVDDFTNWLIEEKIIV